MSDQMKKKPVCNGCKLPILQDDIVTKASGLNMPHSPGGSLVLLHASPTSHDWDLYDLGELDDADMTWVKPYHRVCYDELTAWKEHRRQEIRKNRFLNNLRKELSED